MYYNVAQLLKEPVGFTRTYRIDGAYHDEGGATYVFPRSQILLMRTDGGVWVSAKVEASVALTCSRCLKSFPYPLRIAIEEEYLPTIDINSGQSLRMTEGAEGSFTIDQRHILDLREAIRQYSITNQPMKPLCSRDCRGLCPVCGTDRSEDHCSCQGAPIDPRLLPLLELRECDGD